MKVLKKIKTVLMICMMFFSSTGLAEQNATKLLASFIAQAQHIKSQFTQTSFDESGRPEQVSSGRFYLQQPSKFRWDYTKPYIQQIISKDHKVWFYDADLEQVIIKKLEQSIGDTPALLLSGQVDLDATFIISYVPKTGDEQWLKLVPKSESSNFKYILVSLKDGLLYGMELSDNFGQLTRIIFTDVQMPSHLPASVFEFIIPKGTDVFEG